ncbi:hypothetical protein CBR_g28850 [Chara braunii]|uniref:Integrase catalytic domain-containing protein n=1 Tax=Chara braunii TaxID=69332 RepID=A0A388L9Z1_CHABU|nr:hypothetical protein CBR_g28850 [Chara braunii]|eukprot:GBG79135.1 hypothetical protein CBR_g28850 [Chara braunii]
MCAASLLMLTRSASRIYISAQYVPRQHSLLVSLVSPWWKSVSGVTSADYTAMRHFAVDSDDMELDLSSLSTVHTVVAALFSKLGVPIKTLVAPQVMEEAMMGAVHPRPLTLFKPVSDKVHSHFTDLVSDAQCDRVQKLEALDDTALNTTGKILKANVLSMHAYIDNKMDAMQDTLDQILQVLHKPGIRPAALPSLPLSAMTSLYAAQSGPPPSVSSTIARSQTVASSSFGPATVATPQSPAVSQAGQQYPWYPKTLVNPPATFSGDKKDEALDTWLRTVPVWVRAKRTLVEEEVITVASYLEGSTARWLNGLVASKGFGKNMHDWAQTHTLESFMDLVEARWHNPQQAQIAIDGLLKLDTRKYKSVRELTTAVERLIVVPGVEYNPQVLLTMFLRFFPTDIRNLLASEARGEYHTFESFSKKALDLEVTLGGAQTPSTDGRKKKTPQEWKKKGSRLMMVDSDGNQTEIDDIFDLVEGSEFDGEESAEGSNLAAVVKTKAAGRGKGGQQRSQGQAVNPNKIAAWVRAGLDQEVWRDRWSLGACINCGEWSARDPRESWVAQNRGPRGEHFVVEVDVGGRKCGAFVDIGSTQNFISRDCVDRLCLKDRVQRLSRPVASTLANKECMMVEDYVKDVVCTFSYPGGEINHKISFVVSDELPFDMLLGMYYLEVAKPPFDWDKKVLKHELPSGRTVRLAKYKASRLVDSYGCLCASAFYNYYKQNQEEGMYLVYVSAKGEAVKTPPDLFEEPTGVVDMEIVHAMEIIPGSKTPKGRIYRMAAVELDELRRQLKELTEKGWIRPSTSHQGCALIIEASMPSPLRTHSLYHASTTYWIGCRGDLKSGYHKIAIRPEDQHKTAFQTRYGLYEFVVMPFGLCNAPGTFQHAMNRIFHDYLNKFVVVYLDDMLIFGTSVEEHAQHVDKVLSLLRQHKYKINFAKCELGRTRIPYLAHEVSADGIRPEDAKVASIRDWPRPQFVTEVRSFLGMCAYYRNFVKNYSTITSPLTDLTRLDTPWDWTDECEAAFKRLKHALAHHEVLMVPDPQRPFVVTTDASQYGIGSRAQALLGLLKPLPIRAGQGKSISMDFMDTLVTSKNGKWHIFVIVDRFTKYARLIAMPETARTEHVIKLFMDNWVRDFGLPKTIVSDRDVRFTSEMWKKAAEQMGSQLQMTSGNHPEANGQAEQMNRVVQHPLRHYIKPSQDDWDEKLPLIASLYNNDVHNTIGVSPNQLHLGWKPRSSLDFLLPEIELLQLLEPSNLVSSMRNCCSRLSSTLRNLRRS